MPDLKPNHMYPILDFFEFKHLPSELANVSTYFRDLAFLMAGNLDYHPETSAGLRKLLEAKDCFVRAALLTIRTKAEQAEGNPDEVVVP